MRVNLAKKAKQASKKKKMVIYCPRKSISFHDVSLTPIP